MTTRKLTTEERDELKKLKDKLKWAKTSKKELLATVKFLKSIDPVTHKRAINLITNIVQKQRNCEIEFLQKEIHELETGTRKNYIQLFASDTGGL